MAKERAADDNEPLSITDALWDLWSRANRNLTTSQELEAISPEQAKAYRLNKEIRDAQKQIQADLAKDRQERAETKAAVKRGIMQIIKGIWPD